MSKIRRSLAVLVTVLACLAATTAALAERSAYMRVKGKSGEIKGDVNMKGREGTIEVVAIEHSIVSPMDMASGQASGRRQHKPFVFTKELDRSSPLLRQALARNEVLTEVTVEFYAASPKGTEVNTFTVTLKNARVTSIDLVMDDNRVPENVKLGAYERIGLVYEGITWTWIDGGITATDSNGGSAR